MSKVKLIIEKSKNTSQLEAEALIIKALTNDVHREEFQDAGNQAVYNAMEKVHEQVLSASMEEINKILDEE